MPFPLPDTPLARSMSSPSIDSSPLTEESCSGSPDLSNGFQGGSLENHEVQSMVSKGAKCEHKATKDSTGCFCCNRSSCTANVIKKHDEPFNCSALDCKRTPLPVSADIRQRPTECITQARSYTALFQPANAITEKALRETNNSRITFDLNILITKIT